MSKNVTAPRRWKSSPNSPSTQLAYVTQPEIDLLVKANLHGSMKGKPNKGPKGIISLDGGGGDYRSSRRSAAPGGTGGRTGAPDTSAPSRDYGGGGGGGEEQRNQASRDERQRQYAAQLAAKHAAEKSAADDKKVQQLKEANQRRIDDMREKQAEQDRRKEEQTGKKPGLGSTALDFLSKIGHGPVQEDYIGDEAFKETIPTGQHKLRSQFDRLTAKYGDDFYKTSQGKDLLNYLSGVAVERGGGLGAFDPEYGGGKWGVDEFGNPIDPKSDKFKEAEKYRQSLLNQMSATGYDKAIGPSIADQLGGINYDLARFGLSPDQYFNFNQQLMAADPSVGNVDYKAARPFSSGNLLQGVASLAPGLGTIGRFAKSALGGANEMFGGIPGDILSAGKQMAGDVTGRPLKGISDWFKFNPPAEYMGTGADPRCLAAMQGRPMAANVPGGEVDRGGVIDAAQSVVERGGDMTDTNWGKWIGYEGPKTMDFIDSDGDGVDDRYQTGPGTPNQEFPGADLKMDDYVGPIMPIMPMPRGDITAPTQLASAYKPFNFPIGGGQDPNLQDWYKNLGIMSNVYS